ncbi:hypothetical protein E1287_33100 [Actinomadura sp. KC06]|nr:hypothetical protein E1287_33100 [Actinomadura sp. KC06]
MRVEPLLPKLERRKRRSGRRRLDDRKVLCRILLVARNGVQPACVLFRISTAPVKTDRAGGQ